MNNPANAWLSLLTASAAIATIATSLGVLWGWMNRHSIRTNDAAQSRTAKNGTHQPETWVNVMGLISAVCAGSVVAMFGVFGSTDGISTHDAAQLLVMFFCFWVSLEIALP